MIEILLLDLDDTILDFHKAERIAIAKTFRGFGIDPTEEVLSRYHTINRYCWEQLETGAWTRDEVLVRRFEMLFGEYSMGCDGAAVAKAYEKNLSIGHYFLPGAEEAVKRLHAKYRLFLVSNGTACVQHGRLTSAGLYPWFEKVFVSQEVGYNKPAREYFDRVFAAIEGFDPQKAIIVGDSLTSDIQGGINAGVRTCWVNPDHKTGHIKPDHEIEALHQLEALLETL